MLDPDFVAYDRVSYYEVAQKQRDPYFLVGTEDDIEGEVVRVARRLGIVMKPVRMRNATPDELAQYRISGFYYETPTRQVEGGEYGG